MPRSTARVEASAQGQKDGIREDAARNALRNERQVSWRGPGQAKRGWWSPTAAPWGMDVGVPGDRGPGPCRRERLLERSKQDASEERKRADANLVAVSSRIA